MKLHERPVVPEPHEPWTARGRAARKAPPNRLMRLLLSASVVGGISLLLGWSFDERFLWGFYLVFGGLFVALQICARLGPDALTGISVWHAVATGVVATLCVAAAVSIHPLFLHGGAALGVLVGVAQFRSRTVAGAVGFAALFFALAVHQGYRDEFATTPWMVASGPTSALAYAGVAIAFLVAALWMAARDLAAHLEDQPGRPASGALSDDGFLDAGD